MKPSPAPKLCEEIYLDGFKVLGLTIRATLTQRTIFPQVEKSKFEIGVQFIAGILSKIKL